MNIIKKIIKEPLVHFFILGGILFFIFFALNPQDKKGLENIRIEASQMKYLIRQFEVKKGRLPSENELKRLLNDYVKTEVYYREAVSLGLDKNDDVIKNHLYKKLRMMASDTVSFLDINDTTLRCYMNKHSEEFILPSMYRFYQVYIDPKKHTNDLQMYLKEVKKKLDNNISIASESKLVKNYYPRISKSVVSDIFGKYFYRQLNMLTFNQWSKPLKSDMGYHFVKLVKKTQRKNIKLKDIHSYVLSEYSKEKYKEMLAKQYQKMKAKYKIVFEKKDIKK